MRRSWNAIPLLLLALVGAALATVGTATTVSAPAASGPAALGRAASEPAALGPAVPGPAAVPGPGAAPGPAALGPAASEPAAPGPAAAGPAAAGPDTARDATLARGLDLYVRHCASCHGPTGRGDGPAAYLIYPRPRDFGSLNFRIVSGEWILPTDDDLAATIARGMPGSAMPPWGHMPESDLDALVAAVRHWMVEARVEAILASDDGATRDDALEDARYDVDPGDAVEIPTEPAITDAHLARGRELYMANCAHCHDADGRGLNKRDLVDSEGMPIFARDFTRGVFKGGTDGVALARRITLGMPGSPMPETAYPPEDLWAIVHHVQSLVDEEARDRATLERTTLRARRVEGELGADPTAAMWDDVPETWVGLLPLWWRFEQVDGVRVRALHDGRRVAVRLSWADATRDDTLVGQTSFADAAAVQLAEAENPPFFGMGAPGEPVTVWQWKAAWQRDLDDVRVGLAERDPDMPSDRASAFSGVPEDRLYATAREAGNLLAQTERATPVEVATVAGLGTLSSRPPAVQTVRGGGVWADGAWHVVLLLEPPAPRTSIGFAIWDGAAGDRNGQKAFSIWHALVLED